MIGSFPLVIDPNPTGNMVASLTFSTLRISGTTLRATTFVACVHRCRSVLFLDLFTAGFSKMAIYAKNLAFRQFPFTMLFTPSPHGMTFLC
jgi:hypothetical protein